MVALLYVTVPNPETAVTISHALVDEKLAACTNILGDITSIYRWDGMVNETPEVAMLIKTTAAQADNVITRIASLHPYECPAILRLPVNGGFAPFLEWIEAETNA